MQPTTGPIAQRLFQYEKEVERVNDERLASARALQEQEASIRELRQQNAELIAKHTSLQSEVLTLTNQVVAAMYNLRTGPISRNAHVFLDMGNCVKT